MAMIEPDYSGLSIRQQADLLGVTRSMLYYSPAEISSSEHDLMRRIDEIYTRYPFYGYRRIGEELRQNQQLEVNNKKVLRLM